MSLFDDEFYSTRVKRRPRLAKSDGKTFSAVPLRSKSWSKVRIAVLSSVASSVAVVLVFGLFVGFDRGGGLPGGSVAAVSPVQTNTDPYERTIQAADKVRPAVVSIINEQQLPTINGGSGLDEGEETELAQAAVGSGVIFEKVKGKAHIITNAHVVAGAEAVKAVLSNGDVLEAELVGVDEITDLAVLEIDGSGIKTVAEIGDSNELRAGQWVMAIGNPLGLSDSLSMGIVSKTHRIIPVSLSQDGVYDWEQEVIQVDASINQGNSGGPLIDLNGKVVGINSMKVADFGVEGVGFAIPSHSAMPIVQSLLEYGKVKRPYLGVYTMDLQAYMAQQSIGAGSDLPEDPEMLPEDGEKAPDQEAGSSEEDSQEELPQSDLKLPKGVEDGVIVLEAVGPSAEAGLEFNDIIVKLDKQSISSTMELRKYLYGKKSIGDDIQVTYYRGGEKHTVTFTLEEKMGEE
ncbi:S1C family serine protease [Paenibacillus spongiae]|uniref:Trypsin-like peptidase domain-containing protein n=1 Tax=Paenibacillus spongiae TaxID=2909671 RepID=A0ABY5S8Q3_9BACL|nr:trypsin-like peptidase domain-containing protein [Paenibacillus spongiae]UVI30296.1 trypsin-like peptidase domain-containing protein [Paenibacillus spongiae]